MTIAKSLAALLVLLALVTTASADETRLRITTSNVTSGLTVFNPDLADAMDELYWLLDYIDLLQELIAEHQASRPVPGNSMSKSGYEKALKKWEASMKALASEMDAVDSQITAVLQEIDYLTR